MTGLTLFRIAALGLCLLAQQAAAAPVSEYEMKAAFIYNFAVFTAWPSGSEKETRLCVIGKDNFGNALDL